MYLFYQNIFTRINTTTLFARQLYPDKKGYLGKAVTSAMQKWINEVSQNKISQRELELLEKGFKMGKIKFKSREELYER